MKYKVGDELFYTSKYVENAITCRVIKVYPATGTYSVQTFDGRTFTKFEEELTSINELVVLKKMEKNEKI